MDKLSSFRTTNAVDPMRRNRTALITGGSFGLGAILVDILLDAGWFVTVLSRSVPKPKCGAVGRLSFVATDLSSHRSIQGAVDCLTEAGTRFDLVVCNAAALSKQERRTEGGVELHMAVNFLSHALLVALLHRQGLLAQDMRLLVHTSPAAHRVPRVVSADLAGFDQSALKMYAKSKRALNAWAAALHYTIVPSTPDCEIFVCELPFMRTGIVERLTASIRGRVSLWALDKIKAFTDVSLVANAIANRIAFLGEGGGHILSWDKAANTLKDKGSIEETIACSEAQDILSLIDEALQKTMCLIPTCDGSSSV